MMGLNLSALAVRERAITLFMIIALVAIGSFSYLSLGRAEDPPFTVKTLTVIAAWPGATAKEMQDLVADPMEKRMQELQWYDRVETYTRPGLAALMVTLKDTIPPKDASLARSSTTNILTSISPSMPSRAMACRNARWCGWRSRCGSASFMCRA
jgi:multidrug efflux pump subunit AcrB